jgi:segregation and condensation protein B
VSDETATTPAEDSPSGVSAPDGVVEGSESGELEPLARDLEALLFLAPDPLSSADMAAACEVEESDVTAALQTLMAGYKTGGRGILLRQLAGGWALSSSPEAEDAARRLFAAPRTPPLSAAQAETLAIVAYLQPVSRPEIARIRGVNAESAVATLLERGLVEESGRSPFGAVLYRTGDLFLRLFGLESINDLPDIGAWDPAPEVEKALRERLLEVGVLRAGEPTTDEQPGLVGDGEAKSDSAAGAESDLESETDSAADAGELEPEASRDAAADEPAAGEA